MKQLGKKARRKLPKWLKGPLRRAWEKLKDIDRKHPFLREIAEEYLDELKSKIDEKIKMYVRDFLNDLFEDLDLPGKVKKYWKELLEWIASIDPVSTNLLPPSLCVLVTCTSNISTLISFLYICSYCCCCCCYLYT